ncbi:MAG: hypothetical protein IKM88_10705 [Lachnospiraceae bacterium]|nr:hypothetical protein [Lachnospiraceae bacterium]MBR3736217.1 hypothetical protein [Lachnospiraceae bacterium]MBR6850695.1 hypothetical protein [Lachnospiraceae bacterium]
MVHKNDLLICAPQRDNEFNKVFDICARVVCVEGDICTLDRYQKFGGLRLKELACNWNEVSEYYRPMTEDEKRVFADTVFGREVKDGKIHLGGDRKFEGWEKISDDVLDTLTILNESRSRSKDEPVLYSPDQWEYDANAYVERTADPDYYHVDGWMRIKVGEYKERSLYIDAEVFIDENGLRIGNFPTFTDEMDAVWDEHPLVCGVINKTLTDYFEKNEQQEKDKYLSIISKNKPDIFEDYISPLLKEAEIEDTGHGR